MRAHPARWTLGARYAYSPEREDPGNPNFKTAKIPKIVGGHGDEAIKLACALYDTAITQTVPVSNTKTAEAVKLTENVFRSVNIALVNELKVIYQKMRIDVHEVLDAADTKPFGFMKFVPGPGLGGHCIPIDPFYLTWKAREVEQNTFSCFIDFHCSTFTLCSQISRSRCAASTSGLILRHCLK